MSVSNLCKIPLTATLLLLAGCIATDPSLFNGGGLTPASGGTTGTAVELAAPPKGAVRTVTVHGAVSTTAGLVTTPNAQVRIKSVTPNNPFDKTVPLVNGRYAIEGVPTSVQYTIGAIVPGKKTKVRLETLLSTTAPVRVFNFGGRYDAADMVGDTYVVGVEWCSEDAAEKLAAATFSSYRTLEDIPIFTAQPINAPTPTPAPQAGASAIPVHSAEPIAVFTAQPIEPCQAHGIRLRGAAGIEETPQQGAPEDRLVGTWKTAIPGAAWSTETISGNVVTTETHVGVGAGLGDMTIQPDGSYQWVGTRGKLRQVMPFNDAMPNTAYWLVRDPGGKDHYCAVDETGTLLFFLPGTNAFIAQGTRMK